MKIQTQTLDINIKLRNNEKHSTDHAETLKIFRQRFKMQNLKKLSHSHVNKRMIYFYCFFFLLRTIFFYYFYLRSIIAELFAGSWGTRLSDFHLNGQYVARIIVDRDGNVLTLHNTPYKRLQRGMEGGGGGEKGAGFYRRAERETHQRYRRERGRCRRAAHSAIPGIIRILCFFFSRFRCLPKMIKS